MRCFSNPFYMSLKPSGMNVTFTTLWRFYAPCHQKTVMRFTAGRTIAGTAPASLQFGQSIINFYLKFLDFLSRPSPSSHRLRRTHPTLLRALQDLRAVLVKKKPPNWWDLQDCIITNCKISLYIFFTVLKVKSSILYLETCSENKKWNDNLEVPSQLVDDMISATRLKRFSWTLQKNYPPELSWRWLKKLCNKDKRLKGPDPEHFEYHKSFSNNMHFLMVYIKLEGQMFLDVFMDI